jgi:hypothetical protein
MSNRKRTLKARTIHPRALATFGEEVCVVMLGVARDLRDGTISPENYDQKNYCGTACCIAGHVAARLDMCVREFIDLQTRDDALWNSGYGALFRGSNPSDPLLAADAIERYVYDGAERPWLHA